MATDSQSVTIEGFVTDLSFVNQTKNANGWFVDDGANVASLTTKALSYFNYPVVFSDPRKPSDRVINWPAQVNPKLVVDGQTFSTFVDTINGLSGTVPAAFFKLIDRLLFDFDQNVPHATTESFLTSDSDISAIYVANSFSVSSVIVSDTVYLQNGGTKQVSVPSFVNVSVTLPSGSTTTTYILRLYASVDAWLEEYNTSTIVKVIPPLPYDKLLNASLVTAVDNIFATSSLTATLSFNTTQALLGSVSVSGTTEYKAVITDGTNNTVAPFNILYKGRAPTLFEIRNAVRTELLNSGFGDAESWQARIPGVFVTGRFYVLPLWDQTYTKPNSVIYPNIAKLSVYADLTNQILGSLGYGDVSDEIDVFSLYYNRMTATVIPDLSGRVDVQPLSKLIPDYQNYSPSDAQFAYMLPLTQQFSRTLNTIMTVDTGAQPAGVYVPSTEGKLSFYSFTIGTYEICVISKLCYTTIIGSTQ